MTANDHNTCISMLDIKLYWKKEKPCFRAMAILNFRTFEDDNPFSINMFVMNVYKCTVSPHAQRVMNWCLVPCKSSHVLVCVLYSV
jgi:hypothetical protein